MGIDVRTVVTITRPVAVVASYTADPANAPAWYVNIKSVEWVTPRGGSDRPVGRGARIRFRARFLGRTFAYVYEVVEHVPGQRLVMRSDAKPFPMETTYTWEPADGGTATRMELRNRGEPAGFAAVTAPLMAAAVRRANTADLARLRKVLESR